jgi:hypothetical protein
LNRFCGAGTASPEACAFFAGCCGVAHALFFRLAIPINDSNNPTSYESHQRDQGNFRHLTSPFDRVSEGLCLPDNQTPAGFPLRGFVFFGL